MGNKKIDTKQEMDLKKKVIETAINDDYKVDSLDINDDKIIYSIKKVIPGTTKGGGNYNNSTELFLMLSARIRGLDSIAVDGEGNETYPIVDKFRDKIQDVNFALAEALKDLEIEDPIVDRLPKDEEESK